MNPSSDSTSTTIPFAKPSLGREEEEAVIQVMRSGWLTSGEQCRLFEQEFSRFLENNPGETQSTAPLHTLSVNSATAGLHLAMDVLGVRPGDRVAMSPYTFVATAEVVRYMGGIPVFVDIEPGTFHLDPAALAEALDYWERQGSPIRGVIAVHISGCSWRMAELAGLCSSRGIWLVEDAAHSFPSRTSAGFHGTLGDIGVFSFYANKTITTGEGGMVVTRNATWAESMKRKRLHGISREVWNRYRDAGASWQYEVTDLGYKYNLTDLAAAMGRQQLLKAQGFLQARRAIARDYTRDFLGWDGIQIPPAGDPDSPGAPKPLESLAELPAFTGAGHAWHLYILQFPNSTIRDRVHRGLAAVGIGTSMHFIPLHRMPYYRELGWQEGAFPRAEYSADRGLSIPIYPDLPPESRNRVVDEIKKIFDTL
ncbi:DegT/DnrJ/EryC1/StrS family aminotransferase [Spirochaeta lutea]|uniref:Pyridoxal phosphate-dependent aminotransferase n=1 Tax=Spirochaeta lutea TaxID=1480694 RepID=A0A098QY67_9SPIO|nr:DegT/DnrJ/EryC1/StrS aminotransferase family protein [Spirochaeta lutea]KGE71427.1 hypothetical protein DC28_11590 [Spirochaeta lutea]